MCKGLFSLQDPLLVFCALLLNLCYLGLNIELVINSLSVPRSIWFSQLIYEIASYNFFSTGFANQKYAVNRSSKFSIYFKENDSNKQKRPAFLCHS